MFLARVGHYCNFWMLIALSVIRVGAHHIKDVRPHALEPTENIVGAQHVSSWLLLMHAPVVALHVQFLTATKLCRPFFALIIVKQNAIEDKVLCSH